MQHTMYNHNLLNIILEFATDTDSVCMLHTCLHIYDFCKKYKLKKVLSYSQIKGCNFCYDKLCIDCDQPIDNLKLPSSLKSLIFGHYFNQKLDNLKLSPPLVSLTFGDHLNQPIDNLKLPSSLTSLTYGSYFKQPINNLKLPRLLTS